MGNSLWEEVVQVNLMVLAWYW